MFKKISKFFLLITVILVPTVYLIFFLNSDAIKSKIEEYISSKIDYTFVYDSDLEISYEPDARISISDIRIFDESYAPIKK